MKKIKNIFIIFLLLTITFLFCFSVYRNGFGLSGYTDTSNVFHRGKTLWDWLDLLIAPGILAIIAWKFTDSQKNKEIEVSSTQYRENVFHEYILNISSYITDGTIYLSNSNLVETIRINTLNTLRILDGEQKGQLIRFLHDAKLIGWSPNYDDEGEKIAPIIRLKDADLNGINLSGTYSLEMYDENRKKIQPYFNVNLNGIDLSFTNLSHANLQGIQIFEGNFTASNLEYSKLSSSEIESCSFGNAKISNAYLDHLYCSSTNFNRAQFSFSKLSHSVFNDSSFSMASFIDSDLSFSKFFRCNFFEFYGLPCDTDGIYSQRSIFYKANLKNTSFRSSDVLPGQIKKGKFNNKVILPNNLRLNKFGLFSIKQEFTYINPAHPGMLCPDISYKCACGKNIEFSDSETITDPLEITNIWNASLVHIRIDHPKLYKKYFLGSDEQSYEINPKDIHIPPIYG